MSLKPRISHTERPDCDKGFACGDTCIAKNKSCLALLSPEASEIAKSFIRLIKPSAEDKVTIEQSVETLSKELFKPENIGFLKTATAEQVIARATSWRSDLSELEIRSITDAVFMSLGGKERMSMSTRGGVPVGQMWDPKKENEAGGSNHARTLLILELYIRQNGRDAYTGMPLSFDKMELEHIVPLSKGGADRPGNMTLISRATNSSKGNKNLNEWATEYESSSGLATTQPRKAEVARNDSDGLRDIVKQTDDKAWTSESVDKFRAKFYYISAHLGLRRSLRLPERADGRVTYTTPGETWGVPMTKAMATAKRNSDLSLETQIQGDWSIMVDAVYKGVRSNTTSLARSMKDKYGSY